MGAGALTKQVFYLAVVIGLALLAATVMDAEDYTMPGFLVTGLVLAIGVGIFLIPRLARGEDQSFVLSLLYLGFAAKMVGALVRMSLARNIFGLQDVRVYDRIGAQIAIQIYTLDFGTIIGNLEVGTKFTRLYTGVIYAIFGPSVYGAYLVFGLISFLGSYFFFKAFRVAFPDARHRLFGMLVFLYPSVLYWSNGVGKDALMALFLGLCAFGSAVLLMRSKLSGLVPLGLGLAGAVSVRPHVAGMLVLGLMAAFLIRRAGGDRRARMVQVLVLTGGLVLALAATPALLHYVGLSDLSLDAAQAYFAGDEGEGGSAFTAPPLTDPMFFPTAVVTVLFRPFILEAHNLPTLIQSVDGVLLAALLVWRFPSLWQALRSVRSSPYVLYILVFLALLIPALMVIGNFGTLARERSMVIPFLLMLLAFPTGKELRRQRAALAAEVK